MLPSGDGATLRNNGLDVDRNRIGRRARSRQTTSEPGANKHQQHTH
jgi:hypothetical protein